MKNIHIFFDTTKCSLLKNWNQIGVIYETTRNHIIEKQGIWIISIVKRFCDDREM